MLGNHVVRQLIDKGYEIVALIERNTKPKYVSELPVEIRYGDLLDLESLVDSSKDCDAMIHCAACTITWPARHELVRAINIDGTRNVIEAALRNKLSKLIHVGTANSFGTGNRNKPGTEKVAYNADKYGLDYMDSKYKAQELVLDAVKNRNLPAVIVNPTFMFGAFDGKPNAGKMILAIAEGKVPASTGGGKNFVNTSDVATAIVNALELGKVGECYILGGENLTFSEAFTKIANVVDAKAPKVTFPNFMVRTYGIFSELVSKINKKEPTVSFEASKIACDHFYYSPEKAVKELKMPQNPIEDGIKEFYQWYTNQN